MSRSKSTPETRLKLWATKAVLKLGGFSLPIPGGQFGRAGAPDRIVWWRGKVWAVEFKVGNNKLGPKQQEVQRLIEAAGGTYVVVREPDDLYRALGLGQGAGGLIHLKD